MKITSQRDGQLAPTFKRVERVKSMMFKGRLNLHEAHCKKKKKNTVLEPELEPEIFEKNLFWRKKKKKSRTKG